MDTQLRPITLEQTVPLDAVSPVPVPGAADLYARARDGSIRPLYANVILLLKLEGKQFDLRFDAFSQRPYCRGLPLTDRDVREIAEWVQKMGCAATVAVTGEAVMRAAEAVQFHQVKEYLDPLAWDGLPRIDTFLIDLAGVADTPLHRAQSRKFMIQAVARIYMPGCQADATLILEGHQNLGKSSLLRTLFSPAWFTDHMPDMTSKDAQVQLRGMWGVEFGELAALTRTDAAKIKQFLTSRTDRYREPYGRLPIDVPRSCVFTGTVNPGAAGYLKDETGARRFWPFEVTRNVDLLELERVRDQLWAEAVHRFRAGEPWHLDTPELVSAAAVEQLARYVGDPWQELIERFIVGKDQTSVTELLQHALLLDPARCGQAELARAGRCMATLGWDRKMIRLPKSEGGGRPWIYRRPRTAPIARGDKVPAGDEGDAPTRAGGTDLVTK